MNKIFDTIIWGASLDGIKKAIEIKNQGKNVLILNKYGFPGGKITESLSAFFPLEYFEKNDIFKQILAKIEKQKFGVLYRNNNFIIINPEATKKTYWQLINENKIDLLFHITPLSVEFKEDINIVIFGREGKILLKTKEIFDMSDNKSFFPIHNNFQKHFSLLINCFITEPLPAELPGFNILKSFETPIGQYLSIIKRKILFDETEKVFNNELDRLTEELWKKFKIRILISPTYPELIS